ncbi:(2Fe-2S)-binding protein [Leucobacter sp. CSA2]|uniref:(2Fe-2S)-binding protein n=1 Tax=Leucobacter edaphi TaxID=2796472 RepID=A0A934UWA4_9MICO|nr:(2Fe-2S)-binding protein [Leucobacter edaphi]MBK0420755.1 (2Fe-2S)-binding protein [Leucobacter edaphi]
MSAETDFRPTGRRVTASFEGEPISAEPGASVAAALLASGCDAWRSTRGGGKRGLFCGIGVCYDCIVEIDGESGQRACMIPLTEGMRIADAGRATAPTAGMHAAGNAPHDSAESAAQPATDNSAEENRA